MSVYSDPAWAMRYANVPFVRLGDSLKGCHCYGLVRLHYREEHKIDLPAYGMVSASDILRAARLFKQAKASPPWIEVAALHEGEPGEELVRRIVLGELMRESDVVVMLRRDPVRGRYIEGHCALALGGDKIIQVERGVNNWKSRLSFSDNAWRVTGLYRHEALA
jgi:cell wall-associated NlpC family hydrolase